MATGRSGELQTPDGIEDDLEGRHATNVISCTELCGHLMVKDGVSDGKLGAGLAYVESVGQHRCNEPWCSSDQNVWKIDFWNAL